jgi:creatinine amidohydrolase
MIREMQSETDVFLSTVSWFRIPGIDAVFDDPGDHAGELETSLMMHLHADLVLPLDGAGSGATRPWKLKAIQEGWAWAPRRWSEVTEDTGAGDPSPSTAEKGAQYFEAVSRRVADYLVELAAVDPEDLYE